MSSQPGGVRVRVLNGAGINGLATKSASALQGAGFGVADRGDADSFKYTRSVIRYGVGQDAKARLLSAYLQTPRAQLVSDPSIRGVDLVLVVGSDYSGVRTSAATTPTTAKTGNTSAPSTTSTTIPRPVPVPVPKGAPAPTC